MNQIKLFDIPIYSMTKKTFHKKWDEMFESQREKYASKSSKEEQQKYVEQLKDFVRPQLTWEYNQIVGYVQVYFEMSDICFKIYYPKLKRCVFDSKQKHFVQDLNILGYHFHFDDRNTNQDVVKQIDEWINIIKKNDIPKSRYLDLELYNFYKNKIDYLKLLN